MLKGREQRPRENIIPKPRGKADPEYTASLSWLLFPILLSYVISHPRIDLRDENMNLTNLQRNSFCKSFKFLYDFCPTNSPCESWAACVLGVVLEQHGCDVFSKTAWIHKDLAKKTHQESFIIIIV